MCVCGGGLSAFGSTCYWSVAMHRVVPVGEMSVIIAVSATHRKEAIQATSFAIDAIKSSLTIWKKVFQTLHPCTLVENVILWSVPSLSY